MKIIKMKIIKMKINITKVGWSHEYMRVSERVPKGRIAELSNLEMFQEHEEVIVFTGEEFNHFYNSMQINYINNIDLFLDRGE